MTKSKRKLVLWIVPLCVAVLALGIVACSPQSNTNSGSTTTPEADSYGVITAASWAEIYPDEYESYMAQDDNSPDSDKHDYLELYPSLLTMYKGYAFALGYDEASGHLYSLESVTSTPRTIEKEQLANCITCKTPQFTALVNSEGDSVYTESFNDLISEFTEPISCYNCHENDPETLTIVASYWINSLGEDADTVDLASAVCGQCHNEYYFDPDTKATTNPYSGLDEMDPDSILAYYNEMGFVDWYQSDTLAPMIKVQHPEYETMYNSETTSPMAFYTCADCHMSTTTNEDGEEYTSHNLISPLENAELIENNCSNCHEDLVAEVTAIQEEEEQRVTEISENIEEMINLIAEKYADELTELKAKKDAGEDFTASDELAQLQQLQRTAQFYWDYVMVENSEGAHNSELTWETLDKAQAAVDEAMALLNG